MLHIAYDNSVVARCRQQLVSATIPAIMSCFLGFAGFSCNSALANDRAFGLDGSVYLLMNDGTYSLLPDGATDGHINFHFVSAQDMQDGECKLRLVLTNSTDNIVRYMAHIFKIYTNRDNDFIWFTFGGGLKSQSISPGNSAEYESTFDKGMCDSIVDIKPYFNASGQSPSDLHVDGLAPFDVMKLINYPDVGILRINSTGE